MGVLWFGGQIYTLENEGEAVDAVYTEKDRIKAIGTYESIHKQFDKQIEHEVNLQGKTMLPGFVDSHLHIIGHGEKLLRLDLSQMKSADDVKAALKGRVAHLEKDEWLIGEGWNENHWDEPMIIHKSELDAICPDNPMMLTRVCRHALLANSKAMELAEVDNATPDPESGIIVRDEQGEPTGYFHDAAQDFIKGIMPEVTGSYLENVIKIAINDLVSKGLVGGHTEDLFYYGGFQKTLDAYYRAVHTSNKFKAHLLVHHEVMDDLIAANLGFRSGTDYVELGAIKIFSDGALGGRTAWLTQSYSDEPGNTGVPMHSKESLEALVVKARTHHLPVAIHAIGDKALEEVITAIEKYPIQGEQRDRIIHGQLLNESILQRLKRLPAVVDIQPTFVASDFPWVIDRIGQKRLPLAYAWNTLLNNQIRCAGGSDAPVEQVDPLLGIEAAVLRQSAFDGEIYNKAEQLTVFEAVQLYTTGSAYAIGRECSRGLIKENYKADFTILDEDIFQAETDQIHAIPVAMTVIDGDIVYNRM
ncbi:amidohydrolase [Oceanobacillus sp. FSL K6-2867]|uniref:amidohydrolase n=1 Tax=Oceanobacillus sp. FSL K6-2867 TaxID=2954748 RepID=UPI0030D9DEC9